MLLIDKYAYTNKLSDTNPKIKLIIVVIALFMTTIISNNYMNLGIFLVMVFLTSYIGGIPLNKYLKVLSIPMAFLLISLIPILFSLSGGNSYVWSIKIAGKYIGVRKESIIQAMNLTSRVFASMSVTFFLALTTPLNNIIKVFKGIGLPNIIIELIILIYRFIFIFLEEANQIYMAQELRFGYYNFRNSVRSISLLVRTLILQVFLRYEDLIEVLDCKLYEGEFKIGD